MKRFFKASFQKPSFPLLRAENVTGASPVVIREELETSTGVSEAVVAKPRRCKVG